MSNFNLIEHFARYLPRRIVRGLAKEPKYLNLPRQEAFPAVVLFADISGFTALTEHLAQRGVVGAEELTQILNQVFNRLMIAIEAQGGDVIRFAGDALLVLWVAEDEPLSEIALRAAQCGLDLQQAMPEGELTPGCRLSIKVGIGAGNALMMHVGGGKGQWHYPLGGEVVLQATNAESKARPGDVIISPEAVAFLNEIKGEVLENGFLRLLASNSRLMPVSLESLPLSSDIEARLRTYLSFPVRTRLEARQLEWMAEFRQITTIFIQLRGLSHTATNVLEQLQTALQVIEQVLYRYEGSIVSLGIDDKGTVLLAAFGLPSVAHEDDPLRAVTAAMESNERLNDLGLESSFGITTGRIFIGSVGGKTRCDYTILGDAVNLAARLMQIADGEVLCDAATVRMVGNQVAFDTLPPQKVKGKLHPVSLFRPQKGQKKRKSSNQLRVPIVGRQIEQAQLEEALHATLNGESRAVVIEGEAGIGKSKLIEYLIDYIHNKEVSNLRGDADAIESLTPYYAWRPVFEHIFGLDRFNEEAIGNRESYVIEKFKNLLPAAEFLELAPLLNTVVSLSLPDTPATAKLSGDGRAEYTRSLLAKLLAAHFNGKPGVLIIEDAHWLDTASWALLLKVVADVQPLLITIALRPLADPIPPQYGQLLQIPNTRHLVLDNLTQEEALALVCRRLGIDALPTSVASAIAQKAQGHPFFSEEIALAMRDANILQIADGCCRLAPDVDFEKVDIPDTIEGIITSRIDRLSPQQQLTVKVASAIGRVFQARIIRNIYPVVDESISLLDHLQNLRRLDITLLEAPSPELSYVFKHIITRVVVYNQMLFAQRRRLHQAIGEWYEREYEENLVPFYPLLAHHWSEAATGQESDPQATTRAIDYLQLAAEQAIANSAYTEATRQLQRALSLIEVLPKNQTRYMRELSAQTSLGYALMSSRGYGDPEVERAYIRAHELSNQVNFSPKLGATLYGLFSFYCSRAEYLQADTIGEALLFRGQDWSDPTMRLVGHNSKGLSAILQGNLAIGRQQTLLSIDLADARGDEALLNEYGGDFRGYPRAWLSLAECLLGFPERAQSIYNQALKLTAPHPYTTAFILCFAAVPQLLSEVEETYKRSQKLIDISDQYSFFMLGAIGRFYQGWAMVMLNSSSEGLKQMEAWLPVPRMVKLDSFMPWYLVMYASALSHLGQYDAVSLVVDEGLNFVKRAGGSFFEAELHRMKAGIARQKGAEQDEIEKHLREAIAIASQQGARWWELRATTDLAFLLASSAPQQARTILEPLLDWFTEGEATTDIKVASNLLKTLKLSTS